MPWRGVEVFYDGRWRLIDGVNRRVETNPKRPRCEGEPAGTRSDPRRYKRNGQGLRAGGNYIGGVDDQQGQCAVRVLAHDAESRSERERRSISISRLERARRWSSDQNLRSKRKLMSRRLFECFVNDVGFGARASVLPEQHQQGTAVRGQTERIHALVRHSRAAHQGDWRDLAGWRYTNCPNCFGVREARVTIEADIVNAIESDVPTR